LNDLSNFGETERDDDNVGGNERDNEGEDEDSKRLVNLISSGSYK
jgi:hypothetical protein